ncbi:hypothetical protein N9L68_01560 [bacterium]|nr:hypothetical protein [bacterium]
MERSDGRACSGSGTRATQGFPLKPPVRPAGIGGQSDAQADYLVKHRIGIAGKDATFTAPYVTPSASPAILGAMSLSELRAVIDCRNDVMYLVGKVGYNIELSLGSTKLDLARSFPGHYMLPCSELDKRSRPHQDMLSYTMVADFDGCAADPREPAEQNDIPSGAGEII